MSLRRGLSFRHEAILSVCDSVALTKEHIWPDWLVEEYKLKVPPTHGRYRGTIQVEQKITRTYTQSTITEKRKLVCDRCNSRWMSAIENSTKDFLWPLIEFGSSKQFTLTVEAQCALAIWIQLRSFVFDALHEPPAGPHYSQEERLAFATNPDTFEPLPNTYIWIAPFVGERPWGVDRRVLNGCPLKGKASARIHVATGMANRFAFQLFTTKGQPECAPNFDALLALEWPSVTFQIWPFEREIKWPASSLYLDDASLKLFQSRLSPGTIGPKRALPGPQALTPSPEKG